MKSLTLKQALTCEQAKHKQCRCRCGGAKHGAARASTREELEALPIEDSHHLPHLHSVDGRKMLSRIIHAVILNEQPTRGTLADFDAFDRLIKTLRGLHRKLSGAPRVARAA